MRTFSMAICANDPPAGTLFVLCHVRESLSPDFLRKHVFDAAERHDLVVEQLTMRSTDYADVLRSGRDALDIINQQALLQTGLRAHLWNARVMTDHRVREGTILVKASGAERTFCIEHRAMECADDLCVVSDVMET